MSGPEFFQTAMGRKYYEVTLPQLVAALNSVAIELRRANDARQKGKNAVLDPVLE